MHPKKILVLAVGVCAASAVAVHTTGSSSARAARTPAACTGVSNAEAIIDDSGSMSYTDSNRLRVSAVDLLIDRASAGMFFGAIEFGDTADTIFKPEAVGPNAAVMKSALAQKLHADNGTTDYNLAFQQGRADNPNANGWLFITDGGHNVGAYANGHRGLAPVMVIGLGIGPAGKGNPDADRLQQIANETGGQYFPALDSSSLQATANTIGALWTCQLPPRTFHDKFTRSGQAISHAVKVPKGVKIADITESNSDPNSRFDIIGVRIVRAGHIVASSFGPDLAAKKRPVRRVKLKITRKRGSTYLLVHVTRMVPGQLRFKVRATRLGNETTVTTQIGHK